MFSATEDQRPTLTCRITAEMMTPRGFGKKYIQAEKLHGVHSSTPVLLLILLLFVLFFTIFILRRFQTYIPHKHYLLDL